MSVATGRRIDVLARSKALPPGFMEDRRSVYWIDRAPLRPGPDGTTQPVLTARQEQLCQAKNVSTLYKGDRPTPMWPVSDKAKAAEATERLSYLAQSRPVHPEYKYVRSVYTTVSDPAKQAEPSDRLVQLSNPKPHKVWANSDDMYREGEFTAMIYSVNPSAMTGGCSGRVEQLAEHKFPHAEYKGERPVQWPVLDTTKNASATTRLQQLARPKSGKMIKDDYDPYKVTLAARTARPNPRISELCVPLPRKVRQKKA